MVNRPVAPLELDQIQRIVLRGSSSRAAAFHFLNVSSASAARRFLREIAPSIATAGRDPLPGAALSIALTYAGMVALGVRADSLAGFCEPFRVGMAERAAVIGDLGADSPENWQHSYEPVPHILLWVTGAEDEVNVRSAALLQQAAGRGLSLAFTEGANWLPGKERREHFGFADGLSQPRVQGDGRDPDHEGTKVSDPLIPAGEFVLGYHDLEGVLPPAPAPDVLARNGSYLVYRKLEQGVWEFRKWTSQRDDVLPERPGQFAAKLVGRWPDGTPVVLSPLSNQEELARSNNFSYAGDVNGWSCPLGAHIRRANPRDSIPFGARLVSRHRMIRRGIPYGPPLPPEAKADDNVERGLIFACFVADPARQFEFVQANWLRDGNAFGLGADRDPIVGSGSPRFLVSGRPPRFACDVPDLVRLRWGEYLFAPGIRALEWIAAPNDLETVAG